jgi:hypothetical protein
MKTDSCTYSSKRVAFTVKFKRLCITLFTDKRDKTGDIHMSRTAALAWGADKFGAYARFAVFQPYMIIIFMTEMTYVDSTGLELSAKAA